MIEKILGLLKEFLSALGSWFWHWFTEFGTWLFEHFIGLIAIPLGNALGTNIDGQWAVEYWNKLNYFLPVNETFAILYILFCFWISAFVMKVILKLFPTIY